MNILGICGSLRKDSYNKALLVAAGTLLPPDTTLETFDIEKIPPFNQDLEKSLPEIVVELKKKIRQADAVLISTPEYNFSIPGALKNAIDWASRPYGDNTWDNKPVAIMGASGSALGTVRAQYHLRQTFVFLNIHTLNRPELMVSFASEKFKDGKLVDKQTEDKLRNLLQALVELAASLKR